MISIDSALQWRCIYGSKVLRGVEGSVVFALAVYREEGVFESLLEAEAFGRIILHHASYEVKKLPVIFRLACHVIPERFAVFLDVSPRGAVWVPVQFASVDISTFLGFLQEA